MNRENRVFSSEGGIGRFSWALVRFSGDALQSNWSQSRRLLYTDQNREAKMEIPVEETRQYIRDFDRLAGMTETARELYDKVLKSIRSGSTRYPFGFRRARPNRKLFRMKGVFLCGNCNS